MRSVLTILGVPIGRCFAFSAFALAALAQSAVRRESLPTHVLISFGVGPSRDSDAIMFREPVLATHLRLLDQGKPHTQQRTGVSPGNPPRARKAKKASQSAPILLPVARLPFNRCPSRASVRDHQVRTRMFD